MKESISCLITRTIKRDSSRIIALHGLYFSWMSAQEQLSNLGLTGAILFLILVAKGNCFKIIQVTLFLSP